ncbi:hypothetical protein HQ587_08865 [bacterium]|nr:hypothetical protein [bacterium]
MNYHGLKMSAGFLFVVVTAVGVSLLIGACDNGITNPPPPPPVQRLEIFPVNGAYEVDIGKNFYIGAHFHNQTGNPIRGERVYFSVTPDTVGEITPWATTEPDSNNGFETNVVFNGTVKDTVLIRGWVGNENIVALDTMSIWVRPPINE